jgi:hypothetical protein
MKNRIKKKLNINLLVSINKYKIKFQHSKTSKDKLNKKKYYHNSFNNRKMLINS